MAWYERNRTFQRSLANPYFQTTAGKGAGGSAGLMGAPSEQKDRAWTGQDYAALGGLLAYMGDKYGGSNAEDPIKKAANTAAGFSKYAPDPSFVGPLPELVGPPNPYNPYEMGRWQNATRP